MKKLLLLVTLAINISGAFSQEDTLFPNVTASWDVTVWTQDIGENWYDGYNCELLNDTIDSLGYSWSTMLDGGGNPVGWVAVDSGKVFYKGNATMHFGLGHEYDGDSIITMYDFNLQMGDTAYYYGLLPMIVEAIDTTSFLGVDKQTFHLKSDPPETTDTWIKGFGSIDGFYRPVMSTFELGIFLCSYNGEYLDSLGTTYFLGYDNPGVCESLSAEEYTSRITVLKGNTWMQVEAGEEVVLKLFNIAGQLIFEQQISPGVQRVELDMLQTGVYIFSIGDHNSGKFVKR